MTTASMDIVFYYNTVISVFTEAMASFVLEWQNPAGITEIGFQKYLQAESAWTLSYRVAGFAYTLQAMHKRRG